MSKPTILILLLVGVALDTTLCQDTPKPLTQNELLKTIDSIGFGDPLNKAPLSVGEEKPPAAGKTDPASKKEKGPTEITALEGTFDNKAHLAIFLGEVFVKDPEFNVNCDKLTAYLKHDDKPAGDKTGTNKPAATPAPKNTTGRPLPTPAPSPKSDKSDPANKGGGLEKAIAEMNNGAQVLITQDKVETDGTISHNIGRGRKAVYEAASGDVTLTGMPTVQQGINTCVALEESTVMVLNREGRLHVTGPHKTVIKDTNSADPKPADAAK